MSDLHLTRNNIQSNEHRDSERELYENAL